jgi:hypothetical protein
MNYFSYLCNQVKTVHSLMRNEYISIQSNEMRSYFHKPEEDSFDDIDTKKA